MAMATTLSTLPEAEHSAQLRKAVIASTVGTAIEWYDFFLYGTAAGLVFGKLYFPNEAPLAGTLAAFGTYFIGFVGRPIGAAIFGHYGDRIGRKATLIATLMCMGLATFAIAFVPTYASIGIWGAILLTVLRMIQGIGVACLPIFLRFLRSGLVGRPVSLDKRYFGAVTKAIENTSGWRRRQYPTWSQPRRIAVAGHFAWKQGGQAAPRHPDGRRAAAVRGADGAEARRSALRSVDV